jgi:hypothetical protein
MDTSNEIKRGRRHGQFAVAALFLMLAGFLYFGADLPLWACFLIAAASVVVNSVVLRVEDSSSSNRPGIE